MWKRAELKARAKAILRHNYWRAFFMSLILLIAGAGYSNIDFGSKNNNDSLNTTVVSHPEQKGVYYEVINNKGVTFGGNSFHVMPVKTSFFPGFISILTGLLKIGIIVAGIAFLLFRLLIGFGLQIGGRRYFINALSDPQTDYKCLSMSFKNGNLSNVIVTMFLRELFTFLWSMLFIIPGIVKGLSYSMIPYILAENPKMSSNRAFEISKEMTRGHKWKIFVLQLSFMGWYFLGSLAFVVGIAFVFPYENAVFAELYTVLRQNVISNKFASADEFTEVK